MMNVGIIFEAARETGDADLLRIATEHCLTTRRYLVRGDGSTAHEGIFELDTGEFLRRRTHQGWRADSSWARGQAWALYGFGTAYALSRRCALPRHRGALRRLLPRPNRRPRGAAKRLGGTRPPRPYESSAAAITASGLWQLAGPDRRSAACDALPRRQPSRS